MIHKPGKANGQADALSRMSQHQVLDEDDNLQQIVLKPEHFIRAATLALVNPLEDCIRQASQREAEVLEGL